jgi:hypothetical protein
MLAPASRSLDVARLAARVAATPAVFRDRELVLHAVLADLFSDRASRAMTPHERERARTRGGVAPRRSHELVAIAAWLLHDEAFVGMGGDALAGLVLERLPGLAAGVVPRLFVEDGERREELVRTCLAALGLVPAGETEAQAADRLAALDSVRRNELLAAARAREAQRDLERKARAAELARIRAQEEEERRQAARTTHED